MNNGPKPALTYIFLRRYAFTSKSIVIFVSKLEVVQVGEQYVYDPQTVGNVLPYLKFIDATSLILGSNAR